MDKYEEILGKYHGQGLEDALKESRYYQVISDLMKMIHAKIPREEYNVSKVPVSTNIREEHFQGQNYQRAVMYLMSNGCEWALKNSNGCTMCGHLAKQRRRDDLIKAEDFILQFQKEFESIDFKQFPLLNVYNNGSFLNDNEIPTKARRYILKKINANPNIKLLVLETRPEFVTEEKVLEIKRLVPDKRVELAIGLEIKDNLQRAICINKGFSLSQYNHAARIITKHLNLRTYVLLKPPFLTEKESIDAASETIEHAFAMGSSAVSLEGCTIQDYTLVKYLKEQGLYTPPWLWSIIEVVKRTHHLGKLMIGMFQFFPSPSEVPHNCKLCSEVVLDKITEYNRTLDFTVFTDLHCACKAEWERELNNVFPSLAERLQVFMENQVLHTTNSA